MLIEQTMEKMRELKLGGMIKAMEEQNNSKSYNNMEFEERLGYLIDYEYLERENKKLRTRIKQAKFKQSASAENIDFKYKRNLKKPNSSTF